MNTADSPRQLTLVALYGPKVSPLTELLDYCQSESVRALGSAFTPYETAQVHATIAGMERMPVHASAQQLLSRNAHLRYDQHVEMRFDNLRGILDRNLPITIRWGGYNGGDRPYAGPAVKPFSRSIYFNRATRKLVLIGWPHRGGNFAEPLLLNLRNELEEGCGIVHKYPNDNDFFQVLGSFDRPESDAGLLRSALDDVESSLQAELETTRLDVTVAHEQIAIAQYIDTSLPLETTTAYSITETDSIPSLYRTNPRN